MIFAAAVSFAFMGCPDGGTGKTGGGTGNTGGGIGFTGGGSGGTTGGGSGGTTGGGSGGTTGGGSGGTTGGGSGGTTGGGSGGTTGGGSGGTTGGGSGGTTGGGTGATCTEIQFTNLAVPALSTGSVFATAVVTPNVGATDSDTGNVDLYQNITAGTFTLGTGVDDNFSTCEHCIYALVDGTTPFFQRSGTMVVTAADDVAGSMSATLTDVILEEVDYDSSTGVTTPVLGGACLHIASSTITAAYVPPPASWTCPAEYYGDDYCDCGCGAQDTDCTSTTDISMCDGCSCSTASVDGGIVPSACDPTNTAVCTTGTFVAWTCDPDSYGDGFSCNCGCGAQDSDCMGTADLTECDDCGCSNTATDGGVLASSCVASNTTTCTAPAFVAWTCSPGSYGDGSTCNCGCGAQDSDCTGTADLTECDTCGCSNVATDGGVLTSSCVASNTTTCTAPAFAAWSCSVSYFGTRDGCDCGCGSVDPDCADAGIGACRYCDDLGSCTLALVDAGVTPGTPAADGGVLASNCGYISPANNAVCQ